MKNAILVLVVLIFSFIGCGGSDSDKNGRITSVKIKSSGIMKSTNLIKSSVVGNGKTSVLKSSTAADGQIEIVPTFDESGKVTRLTYYDGDGAVVCRWDYQYDENGYKTARITNIPVVAGDGTTTFEPADSVTYSYNQNNPGLLLGTVMAGSGLLTIYFDYIYDSEGKLIITRTEAPDQEGDLVNYLNFTYDNTGRIVDVSGESTGSIPNNYGYFPGYTFLYPDDNTSIWFIGLEKLYTYKYDEEGRVSEIYNYNNELIYEFTYTTDDGKDATGGEWIYWFQDVNGPAGAFPDRLSFGKDI